MKRVGIYLRVSTTNGQTTENQRELEAIARRSSWDVIEVFEDKGISGAWRQPPWRAASARAAAGQHRDRKGYPQAAGERHGHLEDRQDA